MAGLIRIDSRFGNIFVAVLGGIYALVSTALLAYYVSSVWDSASMIDRALQICLLGAVLAGFLFIQIARSNLRRIRTQSRRSDHSPSVSNGREVSARSRALA